MNGKATLRGVALFTIVFKDMNRWIILVTLGLVLIVPQKADAIPPPDFLLAVGSQFSQIFSLIAILVSAAAASTLQMLRASRFRFLTKPRLFVPILAVLLLASAGLAWVLDQRQQQTAQQSIETQIAQDI